MDDLKLLDYINGNLEAQDVAIVEQWAEEAYDNRKQLEGLYYTLTLGKSIAVFDNMDIDDSFANFKKRIETSNDVDIEDTNDIISEEKKRFSWRRIVMPIAAFLTGIAITTGLSVYFPVTSGEYSMETMGKQRASCTLPDGTRVWLNSSSKIKYHTAMFSTERSVELEGEGYFEVARDEHAPFVVSSKGVNITVLGTKFNIRAKSDEERVVTTLLHGSVRAEINDSKECVTLKPNDILEIDTNTKEFSLNSSSTAKEVLQWREGKLLFTQRPLKEIAKSLETHFDVHFVLEGEGIGDKKFTCQFNTDDDIDDILSALEITRHLSYRRDGEKIYITSY